MTPTKNTKPKSKPARKPTPRKQPLPVVEISGSQLSEYILVGLGGSERLCVCKEFFRRVTGMRLKPGQTVMARIKIEVVK